MVGTPRSVYIQYTPYIALVITQRGYTMIKAGSQYDDSPLFRMVS